MMHGTLRDRLLVEKRELDSMRAVGTVVLCTTVGWSACLFCIPTLETPLWWMPFVAGCIARSLPGAWAVARARHRFAFVAEKDGA